MNSCIKHLSSVVHGWFIWLDEKVEITVYLIVCITGIHIQVEDLEKLFTKENENIIVKDIYEKYGMCRGGRGVFIDLINDDQVKFTTTLMACKLLRKCRRDQCLAVVIKEIEISITGVWMSWVPFLLNQFITDCCEM